MAWWNFAQLQKTGTDPHCQKRHCDKDHAKCRPNQRDRRPRPYPLPDPAAYDCPQGTRRLAECSDGRLVWECIMISAVEVLCGFVCLRGAGVRPGPRPLPVPVPVPVPL
jgi:hypothetical protein